MDKRDWISVANKQQQSNMGFKGLTPDQQKAVTKLNEVLPEFLWELDECKDVWLSTIRKLESAMYDMKRNFEGLTEYQIGEMLNHGIDWDADGTWFDVSAKPKKAKK
tara:strand:- start:2980 stop:3300 length:321 start_codon:yes stop_codon:yes gene_type:complete